MQAIANQPQAPTAIRTDLGAIFVSLELSRSTWLITLVAGRRKDVEAFGTRRRRRRAAGPLCTTPGEGAGTNGAALSDHRHPGSWPRRILDRSGPEKGRDRKPHRRSGFDRDVAQTPAGKDRRDRRRGPGSRAAGVQARRTARLRDGAPTPEEEDRRRICRERKALIAERIQHVNRLRGLLFCQGITGYEPLRRDRRKRLEELQTGDGRPLPEHLKAQVRRELDRLELLVEQIKAVEGERDALLATEHTVTPAPAAMLLNLKGIGPEFAAVLWAEGLFRHFDNRRQVAAYAGLAPTPWQSGSVDREQGVSKAGNPRLRTTLIQLAWLWKLHQPHSALTVWFEERVKRNGGRLKKATIVALARKLLVALWKYVTSGVIIEGAVLKAA